MDLLTCGFSYFGSANLRITSSSNLATIVAPRGGRFTVWISIVVDYLDQTVAWTRVDVMAPLPST